MATLSAVFDLQDRYTRQINKILGSTKTADDKIKAVSGTTDTFNKKLADLKDGAGKGASGLNTLSGSLKKLVGAYVTWQAVQKGMEISDSFINTASRLNLINDGLQTNAQLQDKIFKAAERSRGSYTDMAASIAKMGLLAKDAFSGNDELIAFIELLQKSFKVGGSSTQEQQSGMYQLTQAMASGKLQGDEFRSIMENAPMIAEAIALYTGKSKGELKAMSAEGTITADVIKNAMFAMSGDINDKFSTMPKTFGDIFTQVKNVALRSFEPVIQKVSQFINSPGFDTFITSLTNGLNIAAALLSYFIDGLMWLFNVIQSNWVLIEPILAVIGLILTAWALTQIPLLIAKLWGMVPPLIAQAAAWLAVNWPILLIVLAVGLLLYSILKFGDTVVEVVGVVGGIFGGFFAFMYNAIAYLVNPFISFAEFFANVFNNPVYSIKKLFVDLASNVLNLVQSIASAIDNVLGTKMADGLQRVKDGMQAWLGPKPDNYKEFTKMQMMDITSSVNFGYDMGKKAGQWAVDGVQGIAGKIGGLFNLSGDGAASGLDSYMINGALPITGPDGGTLQVDMSHEDLRYLQDMAEREYINKFSTATLAPNIRVEFTGDITQEADVDKMAQRLTKILQEEIATVAEGDYA